MDHSEHKDDQHNEMKEKLIALHVTDVSTLKQEHESLLQALHKEIG